jgi:polygalacturonase
MEKLNRKNFLKLSAGSVAALTILHSSLMTPAAKAQGGDNSIECPCSWVGVRAFGAKGDGGVKNNSPAIQDAIDETAAGGGGIVYIPPGTYVLRLG